MKPLKQSDIDSIKETMVNNYRARGYQCHGAMSIASFVAAGYRTEEIVYMFLNEILEAENGNVFLPRSCREGLLRRFHLASDWYISAGEDALEAIVEEIQAVTPFERNSKTDNIQVPVMKPTGKNHPAQILVSSPFSIGQILSMEYDLPSKIQAFGNHWREVAGKKAIGRFVVTGIWQNRLIKPYELMVELQALDEQYSEVYRTEQRLELFEEQLQKRLVQTDR